MLTSLHEIRAPGPGRSGLENRARRAPWTLRANFRRKESSVPVPHRAINRSPEPVLQEFPLLNSGFVHREEAAVLPDGVAVSHAGDVVGGRPIWVPGGPGLILGGQQPGV